MITIASGVFGVGIGVVISNSFKPYVGVASDGIVCGGSMLFAAPVIYFALIFMHDSLLLLWILIFFGIAALSAVLVLLAEITLNVVIPTRRATAES